ncbi:MAG: carbohydrate ABC transporter permease [Treponema sp.]|nr:carbohydrate ABC transporter permease [Treponema sp.]
MDNFKSQSQTLAIKRFFCYLVLILLVIVSLFPFYLMIVNATRSHEQIQLGFSLIPGRSLWKNFVNLAINKDTAGSFWQNIISGLNYTKIINYAENYPIVRGMLNSVIIAVLTALFTTYFSSMTAYGIYMYRFKFRGFAFKFIMAVMMVPTQVSSLGFISLLSKLGLMDSYIGLIVPSIAAPVVFFYMYQSMEATLPFSIVEAARVDGCNEFKTFNKIVIPMMKPAIAVQAIFAFVGSWNNYFMPALVINNKKLWTVPIVIANARNADYMQFDMAIIYMLLCFAVVPLIIVYLFLSKYIISGATAGGVKE